MDPIANKPKRNSRWSRDPILGEDDAPLIAYSTERDIQVCKLLARFRYLPLDYIHAFVGGSEKALSHRLNLLCRKPNLYLARPEQQRRCADANHRPLIYELDDRGIQLLQEHGVTFERKRHPRNFAHELMVSLIIASLELGVRASTSIRLITWSEILSSEKMPPETLNSPRPASIRVAYCLVGENRTDEIMADARPFGLERVIDGKRSYLFFPGIEADCSTEPIETKDPARSSILKKVHAYLAIAEQGIHRSHFGFPNFFVPFVTTNESRMRSMMQLVARITGGRGSKMFLFKTMPGFTSTLRAAASGHMLTEPWERAGFSPISFNQ